MTIENVMEYVFHTPHNTNPAILDSMLKDMIISHGGTIITTEERLEGDGAEFYTLAPTALSFRSTAPLNELQEVQINGVTVDPSNYTLEEGSTIVTLPIGYLKTLDVDSYEITVVSDSKSAKGGFTVKAPELNEHGFYYDTPYAFCYESMTMFFIIYKNGTATCISYGENYDDNGQDIYDAWQYTDNNIAILEGDEVILNLTIVNNGNSLRMEQNGLTFTVNNELVAIDSSYYYKWNEALGSYIPCAIYQYETAYTPIRTAINNRPTVDISGAFEHCTELLVAPEIPDSVTNIGKRAFYFCNKMKNIVIGSNVNHIGDSAFENCSKLTEIIFEGTMEQWNAIVKGPNWNTNVPATYVQCSDGQVAL